MASEPTATPRRYWLMTGSVPTGPFDVSQIHAKLAVGEASWETPGCPVGGGTWLPLVRLPGLGPTAVPTPTPHSPEPGPIGPVAAAPTGRLVPSGAREMETSRAIPFRFRTGPEATNLAGLVDLCEAHPADAEWHLLGGHFEPWLRAAGYPAVADEARTARGDGMPGVALATFLGRCGAAGAAAVGRMAAADEEAKRRQGAKEESIRRLEAMRREALGPTMLPSTGTPPASPSVPTKPDPPGAARTSSGGSYRSEWTRAWPWIGSLIFLAIAKACKNYTPPASADPARDHPEGPARPPGPADPVPVVPPRIGASGRQPAAGGGADPAESSGRESGRSGLGG